MGEPGNQDNREPEACARQSRRQKRRRTDDRAQQKQRNIDVRTTPPKAFDICRGSSTNQPFLCKTKPICRGCKIEVSSAWTKGYEEKAALAVHQSKAKQSQFQTSEQVKPGAKKCIFGLKKATCFS
jgi:hypothetical protein